MRDEEEQSAPPLRAEALARDKWRGGATNLTQDDAPGHTLPESDAGSTADDESSAAGAITGTLRPPD